MASRDLEQYSVRVLRYPPMKQILACGCLQAGNRLESPCVRAHMYLCVYVRCICACTFACARIHSPTHRPRLRTHLLAAHLPRTTSNFAVDQRLPLQHAQALLLLTSLVERSKHSNGAKAANSGRGGTHVVAASDVPGSLYTGESVKRVFRSANSRNTLY